MDADSKRGRDCFSSEFCVEGISINRMSFVDDLIAFNNDIKSTNESNVSSEVFEKRTRLKYKVCKCKVIAMNCKKKGIVSLNNEEMEQVKEHVYLGTIISANGERYSEMKSRISKTNSVANEIEQICKTPELSSIRLRYVKLLISSCLDSKVKFGCALWNVTKYKLYQQKLDAIKPNLLKRVLQLPSATPSSAIQYDFGVNDLTLDILMEKVILAVDTLKSDDTRIARMVLRSMMDKDVPGFCTELDEACQILGVSIDDLMSETDVRGRLKDIVSELQSKELVKRMIVSSKML